MANYAYLSLWFHNFTLERGLHHLEALLTLFPVSAARPDGHLLIRSLDPAQPPSAEYPMAVNPEAVRELSAQFLHDDTAYEVTLSWDLWQTSSVTGARLEWDQSPSPVGLILQGESYDNGRFHDEGHAVLNLGPDHLFTGHDGILTGAEIRPEDATSRAQQEFLLALQEPETLLNYRRYTQENIRMLYSYLQEVEKSLPVERCKLWSEGEDDFAARTKQILGGKPATDRP